MEIGEAVAVLMGSTPDEKCPFCKSNADPAPEKKEMTNDSAELARHLGGMPEKTMRNPKADFDVFERYYVSEQVSGICSNAHHVIPGNAALGNCPEILEWMAGTVSIKKKFYDKPIQMAVKKVKAGERDELRAKLVAAKYPDTVVYGDPDMQIIYSAVGGKSAIHRDKQVSTNKVFGAIKFDVNDFENGVWLPSNNAVDGWTVMADELAVDSKGRELPFPQAYAYNAMRVTKKQFHDAHEAYSTEVTEKLRELSAELHILAAECLFHDDKNSKKDGRYHAPERLTGALHLLAGLIVRDHLDLSSSPSKPAAPWVTSDLSAEVGERFTT